MEHKLTNPLVRLVIMSAAEKEDYDESIYHVPKQRKPVANDMGASVSVFPPLGQVTQVPKDKVQLTALLEVPNDQAHQPWELALWHAAGDDNWTETSMSSTDKVPSTLQPVDDRISRFWFQCEVSVQSLLNFTVKFRAGPDQEWRWLRNEQGMEDGTIIVKSGLTTAALPDDFSEILRGYDSDIKVHACRSQSPGTRLWAVEASVDAAQGEDSSYKDFNLGLPWGGFLRSVRCPQISQVHSRPPKYPTIYFLDEIC